MLDHGWSGLDQLPPGHRLSASEARQLVNMIATCDRYIRALERDHLQVRTRDKQVDMSAIGELPAPSSAGIVGRLRTVMRRLAGRAS